MRKKILLSFSIFVCLLFVKNTCFAQAVATAAANANIITPISITKTADMNFGNIAAATSAGTVVLTPAGGRTKTGAIVLPSTTGTVSAASFNVAGNGTYTYTITLPSTAVTLTSGVNTMTATTFTSAPSATGTLTAGAQTLTVGATLNVGANQVAGTYTTGTAFTVTVNYN